MYRYINASDLSKLLGKKYGFFWTTNDDIQRIVFNKKIKNEMVQIIDDLPKEIIEKTLESMDIPKKRKLSENKEMLLSNINTIKNETVCLDTDYLEIKNNYLNTLPNVLKKAVDTEFTLDYGKVQEVKILDECNIEKTNKLEYLSFKSGNAFYKIGCRFDGPQVEIKTRKNKFLGVPDYERLQLTVYMAVAKKNSWVLKEKWNGEIKDHQILFDQVFFETLKNDIHECWEKYLCI